ncbi:MAG: thiamine-phosphate kinase, partial [Geobacteraceae bacterium]|nr:thiamine-phosphate kinase [Geobacteraceae bacterium]
MNVGRRLGDIGEFGFIDRIAARTGNGEGVVIGIGDDAAAFRTPDGRVTLVTADMLVEGVHFDLSLCDPFSLGRKALAVNLSDVAAMGGEPRHFLLSLAVPSATTLDFLDECVRGMLHRAGEFGVTLMGGDTCSSPDRLVLSITLLGDQLPERILRRRGARPGDRVCVTGTVGDSALGLQLLKRGTGDHPVVRRHLDPTPRVREGKALADARLPSAMIDVSDGLLADLGHILDQSAVGARIRLDALPLSDDFRGSAAAASPDPLSLALAGGEDYELLFTVPPDNMPSVFRLMEEMGTPVTDIGAVT